MKSRKEILAMYLAWKALLFQVQKMGCTSNTDPLNVLIKTEVKCLEWVLGYSK